MHNIILDLFVTCEDGTFEIWKNTVDKGFVFSKSGQLPENTGQISFADMGKNKNNLIR